jgi:hypothetical protein
VRADLDLCLACALFAREGRKGICHVRQHIEQIALLPLRSCDQEESSLKSGSLI